MSALELGNLCPILMHYHQLGEITCDACDASVRRHLAWFEALSPAHRERTTSGAWIGNDGVHWAALALVARRGEP